MIKKSITILLFLLCFALIGCNIEDTTNQAIDEFSKYQKTEDVVLVVDDKILYFSTHTIDIRDLIDNEEEYPNGGYLVTKDKIYFSTTIENYMFNFTFSIYECDLNGKNKTRLFKMDNLVTSPDVVANNMVFYLEHYKENALEETSRVINSYDIINSVYGQVASGKECTISDYRPRNKSDYQGKLLDKPYIPLFKDNSYYEITNTKTNEVKIVGKEFVEKTKYIESLQKFNYETKRIDISNGHILLTYKLDAGNGMNYSYLVFEYDFEKETLEYKQLAFLDVDVLVNIIYLV